MFVFCFIYYTEFSEKSQYINRKIEGIEKHFPDAEHIIYVNSQIQDDTALGRLMHDFHCKNADDMYYEVLAERVRELKETPKGVAEMCKELEELYADGLVSRLDREVYRTVAGAGLLPVHKLRERISCDKPSQIEAALSRLQAGLFLTVCGETRKLSKDGRPYGWPVSLVCTPEAFFPEDVWGESLRISPGEAYARIREQVLRLNLQADEKHIRRFIGG